tara:strand:- start:284 stop:613 length:330 start_codon:yes stop_codon:yes gene_type:complete
MTKFTKDNLSISKGDKGNYIAYNDGSGYKFVARLKYGAKTSAPSFKRFLINHFTVEEYFDRLDNAETPLDILRSKGYLLLHIRQWLKRDGYPQTVEGYQSWRNKRREVA